VILIALLATLKLKLPCGTFEAAFVTGVLKLPCGTFEAASVIGVQGSERRCFLTANSTRITDGLHVGDNGLLCIWGE